MGKDLEGRELGRNLYQRSDGRYEARKKINGTQIYVSDVSLEVVKKQLKSAIDGIRHRSNVNKGSMTLNDYFDEWFEIFKKPASKSTSLQTMKRGYRNYFGEYIGDMHIQDIQSQDIQRVINTHKEDGKAASTIRSALSLVQQCLEHAYRDGSILINPCYGLVVSWENESNAKLWRFLNAAERTRFLKAAEDSWYKEMFYVMLCTGVRVGELGALKWSDIDFQKKRIRISQSLSCQYYDGHKTLVLTKPKTPNSVRTIPFLGECEEMLLAQQAKYRRLRDELGDRWRGTGDFSDCVFVTTMGSPVTRYVAEKQISRVVADINDHEMMLAIKEKRDPVLMERLFPHAFRHTFCSMCYEKRIDVKVTQRLMGHAHLSTTMDIYTHLSEDFLDDEVEKFGVLMTETPEDPADILVKIGTEFSVA